ncbi:ATP-binding cassette domain-containing protein [Actinomadura rudentiformis]|uniref:ATP-binding cassette domain-containing protein n=2 Tax=Actinomadura rudentiformis TaxID=359158 RepID=A0A6H9Z8Y4_9ACTN|nr:ATP-binding cassette domain-containing protein [Actinomadura rudentiformis]
MIVARGIGKRYGSVTALDGVDLDVHQGSVHGLLGHNGAGKTTLVRILTAQTRPSAGRATVSGFDVVDQPERLRRKIGLTGQFASVDEQLSGRDNLILIARLLGAGRRQARARADELLESFGLVDAAGRLARTFSGGMRRRLDLAASLVGRPAVVFLDEPTTGLDPAARLNVWQIVRDLVRDGATVLLTSQYLDEIDRLSESLTVLSDGRILAAGSPMELKHQVGRRTAVVRFEAVADLKVAGPVLSGSGLRPALDEARTSVTVPVETSRDIATIVRALDDAGLELSELQVAEPTLDEVYLSLMSAAAQSAGSERAEAVK